MVDDRDLARPAAAGSGPWSGGRPAPRPGSANGVGAACGAAEPGHQRRPRRRPRRRCAGARAARRRGGGRGRSRRRPASIRDSSATRCVAVDHASALAPPCAPPCRSFHGLLHHDLRAGERRHLREVRDAEHLVPRAERLPGAARPRRPASPPIPASTSSNTSVGGASASTTRAASIARESSPPDATRASGPGRLARVGGEQEGDPVVRRRRSARPARPSTSTAAWGIASSRRCSLDRRAERLGARRARAARAASAAAAAASRSCAAAAASSVGGALLVALELGEPGRRPRRRRRSRRRGSSPYLRPSSRSSWRRRAHRLEPLGIVVDPLDLAAQLLLDVGQLALQRPAAGARARRTAPGRRARRPRRRRASSAGPSSASYARGERLAVRDRVGEQRLLRLERDVLVGVVERRPRRSRRPGSAAGRSRGPGRARRHRAPRARRRARARSARAAR